MSLILRSCFVCFVDYVGFIKRMMKQLKQKNYNLIKRVQVDFTEMEESQVTTPPS